MRKFVLTILTLVTLISAALGYYFATNWVQATIHYKMTVTVETPEGLKSGYAVRELSNSDFKKPLLKLPESVNPAEIKGEAVVVDLGKRGKLFVLLDGAASLGVAQDGSLIYNMIGGGSGYEGIKKLPTLPKNNPVVVPVRFYPIMVMFKDINDPNSVTEIIKIKNTVPSPPKWEIVENRFEELFGRGVVLKDITVEVTDEPVNWGIERHIPWLPDRKNMVGSFPPYQQGVRVFKGDEFSRGKFW